MSGVRCQVSGVRCQVSGVRCQVIFLDFFFYKLLELVGGGSVINGAYPVYFLYVLLLTFVVKSKRRRRGVGGRIIYCKGGRARQ